MSRGATSSTTTQKPKAKDLKTRINEWFRILLCCQAEVAEEQKDYNCLRYRVDFCVTELAKRGDAKSESESESEKEDEEGNEEHGDNEEESDDEEESEEE